MDKFYTVPEVAELLKVSRSKMYRLVQRGVVPHIKIGRNVRIRESDLLLWIEENMVEATQLSFSKLYLSMTQPP